MTFEVVVPERFWLTVCVPLVVSVELVPPLKTWFCVVVPETVWFTVDVLLGGEVNVMFWVLPAFVALEPADELAVVLFVELELEVDVGLLLDVLPTLP